MSEFPQLWPRRDPRRDGINGKATEAMATPAVTATARPPGTVGDLADYILQSATRPVYEVAVVGALGFVAGVAGRQWNTAGEGAGLNLYLILLGRTGIGKEGSKKGLNRVLNRVRVLVPRVTEFIGPTAFASGQALMRHLSQQPCFFSVWGETGQTLQRITHPKASTPDMFLMKALHDLYSLSGRDGIAGVTAYSETEKNIGIVQSPAVTILGESTPGLFYECLDRSLIASGLVPRLLIHEYEGNRPPQNPRAGFPPPESLVKAVADLVTAALEMQDHQQVVQVPLDPEAKSLLEAFDVEVDAIMNAAGNDEVQLQIWNRAHLNALKVATLVAVGCNHVQPLVTGEHARWGIEFVRRSVRTTQRRFETGEAGASDATKAEGELRKKVLEFLNMPPEERAHKRYGVPKSMQAGFCIPHNYLRKRLIDVQPFKEKPHLLQATLSSLVKGEVLVQLDKQQAWQQCKSRGEVYVVGQNWR